MLVGDCMTPRAKFDRSLLPERPDLKFEQSLWEDGACRIAGIDEAGRGALAGPVAAGAVILPPDLSDLFMQLEGVRDSKEMTPKQRESWAKIIRGLALDWGVGMADAQEIDRIGIVPATHLAVARALAQISPPPDHLLIDYLHLSEDIPQTSLIKGDARSLSIACAAILAKTTRDALLIEMEKRYPGYDFARNKGYATQAHRRAIKALGPCAFHRRTFAPVSDFFALFSADELEALNRSEDSK